MFLIAPKTATGWDMSWIDSTTIARSYRFSSAVSAASFASNRTRSATPASSAFLEAISIESSSRSNPSTAMFGYARASEMAAQPTPHATSATLAPGSWSRSWMSGIEGMYSVPRDATSHGRLKSPCASIMSRP